MSQLRRTVMTEMNILKPIFFCRVDDVLTRSDQSTDQILIIILLYYAALIDKR